MMSIVLRILRRVAHLLGALLALAALAALLIGVPWGLWHYIGWPLPDHIPSRDEVEALLLNPLSVTLLLDILACIAWPTWLVFALDVARCVPDALRGVRPPPTGPIHAVAGVLVAAVLLGLVGQRSTAPPATSLTTDVIASPAPVSTRTVEHSTIEQIAFAPPASSHAANTEAKPGTAIVQPPRAGVHDSLWRIAERELGDGARWPELFHANQDRVQADGRALHDPNLVYPGWVLVLPEPPEVSTPPAPPPAPQPPPPPQPPSDHPSPAPEPEHHPAPVPQNNPVSTTSTTGIVLVTGGFVAAGLASAVAAAMIVRRRRRMRAYQPGSGDREQPPPPAPAVRALRITYDEQQLGLDEETDDSDDPIVLTDAEPDQVDSPATEPSPLAEHAVEIGTRDERAQAVDLAALHGLGITGAGAEATARALLVHLLGTTTATVVVPEPDAVGLLGAEPPASSRLRITPDLDAAIEELGSRLHPADTENVTATVLVASIRGPHARLQSLLDNGGDCGIVGILLGHWPAGGTVRVRADGIVTAASPELDQQLRGARLFHVGATDTRDLIELFAAATPTTVTDPPPAQAPDEAAGEGVTQPPLVRGHAEIGDVIDETDHNKLVEADGNETLPEQDEATPPPAEDQLINVQSSTMQPSPDSPPDDEAETDAEPADDDCHAQRPFSLTTFGPLALLWNSSSGQQDLTERFAPKHKALLAFLALYPEGTTRETVRSALWPDATGQRPYNAFYATLSQVRKILTQATDEQAGDLIDQHADHVALNPDLVEVDYWHLYDAEHDRRTATTDDQRLDAWSRIAAIYTGEVAEGMSALWLDGPREAAHRTAIDALAGMAAYYRSSDPQRQLQLLEHARLLNPGNEDIYRDIMRAQAELGLTDAISRTLHLLTTALANIGDRPDPSTLTLARALQAREHRRAAAS
ncbi:DNA-binding SARP family transcriptional activator [Saccharomonospora amisosensis]|uniref:DNA-binding SARP family transcriptional activator n=1 Tax=Saccharomonospora amisosensis TaxID=1128677 RepID=A0A7X5UMW0_9PSEU|nr:hypothetical protein [Saccharomonospora amisosensis]NIJ10513.1 DNA-binding SARP family transcriptional activator [Saccharomonospora amisosensis]